MPRRASQAGGATFRLIPGCARVGALLQQQHIHQHVARLGEQYIRFLIVRLLLSRQFRIRFIRLVQFIFIERGQQLLAFALRRLFSMTSAFCSWLSRRAIRAASLRGSSVISLVWRAISTCSSR